jgi:hypothetical protein
MKGLGFYEAAAQIIPILAIAIGFFSRESSPARIWKFMTRRTRVAVWLILSFAYVAEWRALNALFTEDPARPDSWIVGLCIAGLGGGLYGLARWSRSPIARSRIRGVPLPGAAKSSETARLCYYARAGDRRRQRGPHLSWRPVPADPR